MVAQELAKADAETYGSSMLDSFKIDISHQEMERIIVELELLYRTQPGQWLPVHVRARPPERFPRARAFRRVPPSDLLVSRPLSLARVSFRTRPRVVSTASLTPPPVSYTHLTLPTTPYV